MISVKRFTHGALSIWAVSAVLALAQPARAAEPVPSGQQLGTIEAILNYCSKVDAASAARYEEQRKLMVHGVDEKAVAEVRESDEYKQAYQSTTGLLGDVKQENARETCSKSLESK